MSARCFYCHATGCRAQIESGKLFCVEHWTLIPVPLRAAIGNQARERYSKEWAADFLQAIDEINAKQPQEVV